MTHELTTKGRAVDKLFELARHRLSFGENEEDVFSRLKAVLLPLLATPKTVYTLCVLHRHGEDISVHQSEQGARTCLQAYVESNWPEELYGEVQPIDPGDMIIDYFQRVVDESYALEEVPFES